MIKLFVVALSVWLTAETTWAVVNKGSKFTNRWTAHIEGGEEVARMVAKDLGYRYKGKLQYFDDYYELVREDHPELSLRHSDHLTRSLLDLDEVKWAKQQKTMFKHVNKGVPNSNNGQGIEGQEEELVKYIRKEALSIANDGRQTECKNNIFSCIRFPFSFRRLFARIHQGNISKLGKFSTRPVPHSQLAEYKGPTKNIELLPRKISAYEVWFNDPLWTHQWYEHDYRTKNGPVMDLNIVPVYKKGFTGQGITVGVFDDFFEIGHPDIVRNLNLDKSYDLCLDKPLKEVLGQQNMDSDHGILVAGIIGMEANNNLCGAGIAYNSEIAILNKNCPETEVEQTEEEFAKHLVKNYDMIDIYNFSWGIAGSSSNVCELGEITRSYYEMAVNKGRKGKGVLYVQAAGNGGAFGGFCAVDCYINLPYVIGITSATQDGKRSGYSEQCTSIFATVYTGDDLRKHDKKFNHHTVSLLFDGKCTTNFYGTSASSPIASGIIALLLSSKPELTYRDVMHIIARSAEVAPLADNHSWYRNGKGFWVSNEFGFGLLNAENMVVLAENWKTLPPKRTCIVKIKLDKPETLNANKPVTIPFETDACSASETEKVLYLEHLEVRSLVEFPRRGDIIVKVTSPAGTTSVLLDDRINDDDKDGLEGWPIMSLHNWGENPQGKWFIHFVIDEFPRGANRQGEVIEFTFKFYGMGERPSQLEPERQYAAFRLPNGMTELGTYT